LPCYAQAAAMTMPRPPPHAPAPLPHHRCRACRVPLSHHWLSHYCLLLECACLTSAMYLRRAIYKWAGSPELPALEPSAVLHWHRRGAPPFRLSAIPNAIPPTPLQFPGHLGSV
jgi:hypothetical protein